MFKDREEAARLLAEKLKHLKSEDLVVLAIPRGGVVVGKILAQTLKCPLSVMVVRKLGAPGNPELAIGAVGPDGVSIIDWELARQTGADNDYIEDMIAEKKREIEERLKIFQKKPPDLANKVVILTDDGIATGATTEAAIAWIKMQKPNKIVLAVPVAPPETVEKFKNLVDELFVLEMPAFFSAVGQFYQEFPQIEDEEVIQLLASSG